MRPRGPSEAVETTLGPHKDSVSRADQGQNPLSCDLLRRHDVRVDVGALFMVLGAITRNRGRSIVVPENGIVGEGLPQLPRASVGKLVRAEWLTVREDNGGRRISLGQRALEAIEPWGIQLPPGDRE